MTITIDSLQKLSAKETREYLLAARQAIPQEEEKTIEQERNDLYRQLRALEAKKNTRIQARMAQLNQLQTMALEQMGEIGEPDKFCEGCNAFYTSRKDNLCSIEGCNAHETCLKCSLVVDQEASVSFCSGWDHGSIDVTEEQRDWPSKSGYVSCWICNQTICNQHFNNHYVECRNEASRKCGFRPPRNGNDRKGYTCVKGHCGKVVEGREEKDYHYCYHEDDLCCTLSCLDCGSRCRCGEVHCKDCAKQSCLSCPGHITYY